MRSTTLLAAALLTSPLLIAQDEHGQGPVEPGPIRIADVNIGAHWFGPEIDHADLVGKVVLFEIWGC